MLYFNSTYFCLVHFCSVGELLNDMFIKYIMAVFHFHSKDYHYSVAYKMCILSKD